MFGLDAPLWALKAVRLLAAIPLWCWCLLLALVFALSSGHYRSQRNELRQHVKRIAAEYADHLQADRALVAKAKADAEADRKKRQADADAALAKLKKDNADALAAQKRLAADLRAGIVRLRHEWAGCRADHGAGQGVAGGDADADLRAAGAASLIGAADRADAQVTYLQGLIRSAPQCFVVGE
jgi:hypothetical protein